MTAKRKSVFKRASKKTKSKRRRQLQKMTKRANNRGTKAVHPSERPIIPRPTAVTKRRPIRPIDRQPMRHWLTEKLKSGDFSKQLKWVEEGQTFAVTWCHAARHGWNMSDHAPLFEAWARHTGTFIDGDDPDPRKWKANFRCALHSLDDVQEVTASGQRRGKDAARIYKFLDEPKSKKVKRGKKCSSKSDIERPEKAEESDSGVSAGSCNSPIPVPVETALYVHDNIPDFQRLGVSTSATKTSTSTFTAPSFYGGCRVITMERGHEPLSNLVSDKVPDNVVWKNFLQLTTGETCLRTRCLSGDSGNSSSSEMREDAVREEESAGEVEEQEVEEEPVVGEELYVSVPQDDLDTTDEGVSLDGFVDGLDQAENQYSGLQADWTGLQGLDDNFTPEAAVIEEVETYNDDYIYTSLMNVDLR